MKTYLFILGCLLAGCAELHHVQVGDIDNRKSLHMRPVEVKVSETGIDLRDVQALSRLALKKRAAENTNSLLGIVELFQMGPRTGAGVYSLDYIKNIQDVLASQCTDGMLTGIMSVRETRKYPVISGEIVKFKGYCATGEGI